ncbi:MAG TPA: radical SAM protein [Planctomycetota bacterium]|nr:radical SAM protein [Planctomycetota bacterium]
MSTPPAGVQRLSESSHPRTFRDNTYVYPVLSRRAGGISIGINLNPDKVCNFDCIYCQVDRSKSPQEFFVGLPQLLQELRSVLGGLQPGGALWSEPEFRELPSPKRRVVDISFSGDGEPTTFKNFSEVVSGCVEVKESLGFSEAKTVLITNATGLDRPDVKRGLEFMDQHRGEIWAKLDAGTPEYFALIDNTSFPFQKVLDNILECARQREIVIQSCFMRVRGTGPSPEEISAFVARLKVLTSGGARIKRVQVYTVARDPALSIVSSLSDAEVDAIAARVRSEAQLSAESYYGAVPEGRGLMG